MATTTPDNIKTPGAGDQYALVQDLGALADTVQNALVKRANSYTGTGAARGAWTTAPAGTKWQDTDGFKRSYTRIAGAWKFSPVIASGSVTLSGAAGETRSATISFPPGLFSTAPSLQLTPLSSSPQNLVGPVSYNGLSATGATVWLRYSTSTAIPVSWVAIETDS